MWISSTNIHECLLFTTSLQLLPLELRCRLSEMFYSCYPLPPLYEYTVEIFKKSNYKLYLKLYQLEEILLRVKNPKSILKCKNDIIWKVSLRDMTLRRPPKPVCLLFIYWFTNVKQIFNNIPVVYLVLNKETGTVFTIYYV